MRRVALAMAMIVLAVMGMSPAARAQGPTPDVSTTSPSSAPPYGIAVVALSGATDAAWPLAQQVYGVSSLRPAAIDELHARILCGEVPVATAPQEARDLAESLAAVKGDDAPSRMLLGVVARKLNVRALAVVRAAEGRATARIFLAEAGLFDAATYAPDAGPTVAWSATVQSLSRTFGDEPLAGSSTTTPPPLATHEEPGLPAPPSRKKPFYESGWFWGALGAAAFAGGAIFFATRDNGESTIHLQVQVPH